MPTLLYGLFGFLVGVLFLLLISLTKVRVHIYFVWEGDSIKYGNPQKLQEAFIALHKKLNLKGHVEDWVFCEAPQIQGHYELRETTTLIKERTYIVVPLISS